MMRPFNDVDLHAFVDEQVGPDRRAAISVYLSSNPVDAARVDTWRRQNDIIRSLFATPAAEPVPLWLTVGQLASGRETDVAKARAPVGRAAGATKPTFRPERRRGQARLDWTVAALAFVAGLAVACGAAQVPSLAGWQSTTVVEPIRGFEQRALEAHRVFGLDDAMSVDVTDAPPGTVRKWLERRMPFRVRVPDLRAQGWTLEGGRVVPNDVGAGSLLLYVDGEGDRMSLFAGETNEGTTSEAAGHGMISWIDGSVGYAVIGSRGEGWLQRHGQQIRLAVEATRTD